MKKDIIEKAKLLLHLFTVLIALWVFMSMATQAFKCPKMTNTELLINLPNSLVGKYKEC